MIRSVRICRRQNIKRNDHGRGFEFIHSSWIMNHQVFTIFKFQFLVREDGQFATDVTAINPGVVAPLIGYGIGENTVRRITMFVSKLLSAKEVKFQKLFSISRIILQKIIKFYRLNLIEITQVQRLIAGKIFLFMHFAYLLIFHLL